MTDTLGAQFVYPWTQLTTGNYKLTRPGWDSPTAITIRESDGGKLLVDFNDGMYPTKLDYVPVDAIFTQE